MSSEKRASPRASKAPSVFEPGDGPASTWSVSPTASSPDTAPAANTQRLAGGSEHVGKRIEVWWEGDKQWFGAVVQSYDSATRKHHILYDDNKEEDLDRSMLTIIATVHRDRMPSIAFGSSVRSVRPDRLETP